MSYEGQEITVEDGQPVELFRFSNTEEIFNWTNGPVSVVYNSETYEPISISRSKLKREEAQSKKVLEVSVDVNNPFAIRYIEITPATSDMLQVFRQHSTDTPTPETVKVFEGIVSTVSLIGAKAKISVKGFGSVLEQLVPQQTTRGPCNFVLYDSQCGIDEGQFSLLATVTDISADGMTITVDGSTNTIPNTGLQLSAQLTADSDFFLGGVLGRGGAEYRMVRATTDLTNDICEIIILFPFQTLVVGSVLNLSAGCNLEFFTTCLQKFGNAIRFGGFPFIPNKNPFEIGVEGD